MKFTTIILAGGQSSRMGTNKALIPYAGKPLIGYSIELALSLTTDILICANNHDLDHLGFPVINDLFPVKAPLAGIHAGLTASSSDWNLVLTCDMPNVTKELIDGLIAMVNDTVSIVLPHHHGYAEPLCGFYHRSLLPLITSNLNAGKYSMLDLHGFVPHQFLVMDDQPSGKEKFLFRNMNEMKDLLGM
ncbi:MAG: molybdenum cofactor guanylyltransferase [Bacteroidales bacterium]